jgi:Phytoene dehydrogenase and related proteins
MNTNIVIIGGGIGGLSAGCYLQMNGYRTRIVEMGRECGGVCATWKRGGYVFDGATNWLVGSAPTINLHAMLGELIDMQSLKLHYSRRVYPDRARGTDAIGVQGRRAASGKRCFVCRPPTAPPSKNSPPAIAAVREFPIPYAKPR